MSGLEALGAAIGCGGLIMGVIQPLLDYRSIPEQCSRLQKLISREKQLLQRLESNARLLKFAHWRSTPADYTGMESTEIKNLEDFLAEYRGFLEEYHTLVKKSTTHVNSSHGFLNLDLRRLRSILFGRTGPGMGGFFQMQNLMNFYMMEARRYEGKLEQLVANLPPFEFQTYISSKIRLGREATRAYKAHLIYPNKFQRRGSTWSNDQETLVSRGAEH